MLLVEARPCLDVADAFFLLVDDDDDDDGREEPADFLDFFERPLVDADTEAWEDPTALGSCELLLLLESFVVSAVTRQAARDSARRPSRRLGSAAIYCRCSWRVDSVLEI